MTAKHVSAGAYLRQGDAVVTLLNDTDLEIEAEVPGARAAGLAKGLAMRATLEDGTEVMSEVRTVIPDEDPATRTRQVRLVPVKATERPVAVNDEQVLRVRSGRGGLFMPAGEVWAEVAPGDALGTVVDPVTGETLEELTSPCLLYTSDAADE